MDLMQKNKEMLDNKVYNIKDTRQLLKISQLKKPNDYDLFLIACALCNYDLPEDEMNEAMELRMKYFGIVQNSKEDYSHSVSDYYDEGIRTDIHCVKTGVVNKYGFHEFEINANEKSLVNDLWEGFHKGCLKFVDSKTYTDKIVVSVKPDTLPDFLLWLDKLMISYDRDNMEQNIVFHKDVDGELIDLSTLDIEPFDYQVADVQKIIKMKRFLIGNEQGTGKSLEAIIVGLSLNMPKLVICPEPLRLNWVNEILQAKHDQDVQVLYSDEMFHMGKDWTVIGYKSVKKFLANLQRNFNCMIVDECHYCKAVNSYGNPDSQRADAVLQLASSLEYCYLLSGTPVPSKNKDLFNILKMLQLKEFNFGNKWSWLNYGKRYCGGEKQKFTRWNPALKKREEIEVTDFEGSTNSEELHEILSKVMVRHLRKEVLPHLTKIRQFIPVTPKMPTAYKDIEKRLYHPKRDKETGRKLDTYMGLAMTGRAMLSKIKAESAVELAKSLIDAEESVVIVVNFIESADYVKSKFKNNCCEIRGGMSDAQKQKAIDDFQRGKYKVCILNMVAGGLGITLTKAHTEIIVDYSWLPSDMKQVEDRICRAGQTEGCVIYYIYCPNSIFDRVFIKMLSDKSNNIDTVVDGTSEEENSYNLSAEKLESTTFMDELKAEIKATSI